MNTEHRMSNIERLKRKDVVEGFIPSWNVSSATQYWFESNIKGNRRIVAAHPGGNKSRPYRFLLLRKMINMDL